MLGPLVNLPPTCFFCPSANDEDVTCGDGDDDSDDIDDPQDISKRDVFGFPDHLLIEKRAEKKISFCSDRLEVVSPKYDSSGDIVKKETSIKTYGYQNPEDCNDYNFGLVGIPSDTSKYATEHILEFQLLKIFIEAKSLQDGLKYKDAEGDSVDLCHYLEEHWSGDIDVSVNGGQGTPIELLPEVYPGKDNGYVSEFTLLDKYVNGMKERVSPALCSFFP